MEKNSSLRRSLGGVAASSLVVGTVIGTGVFLKTTPMSQVLGAPKWILLAWVAAGALSLMGALVYAELGSLFPQAGGEFLYLKKGYGNRIAFLYGWQRFWVGGPGSIAAYAVGAASFAAGVLPLSAFEQKALSVLWILFFTGLNCLAVSLGGWIQVILTVLKSLLVVGLAIATFCFSTTGSWSHLTIENGEASFGWRGFGVAMISALWAFDGWNNLPMAAGEVKNPEKNVPLALTVGLGLVLGIYCLANLGYFYALPFREIVSPGELSVAARAAETFLGSKGVILLTAGFIVSALGAMHGSILTGARVPYAMAAEGLAPRIISQVHQASAVPMVSVIAQGIWASILALSGTFEMLTDSVVFSSWVFYGLCGFALIRIRSRFPLRAQAYRAPFYPVLPVLFCLMALTLLINSILELPKQSLFGLIFILLGLPVYQWGFKRAVGHPSG